MFVMTRTQKWSLQRHGDGPIWDLRKPDIDNLAKSLLSLRRCLTQPRLLLCRCGERSVEPLLLAIPLCLCLLVLRPRAKGKSRSE